MTRPWVHRAACTTEDPDLFFPIGKTGPALVQIQEAKRVCERCPVRDECLTSALSRREHHGVWGGLSENERLLLAQRNARAALREKNLARAANAQPDETRVCRICAIEQPIADFGRDAHARHGRRSECRPCYAELKRARRSLASAKRRQAEALAAVATDRFPAPRDDRWSLDSLGQEACSAVS